MSVNSYLPTLKVSSVGGEVTELVRGWKKEIPAAVAEQKTDSFSDYRTAVNFCEEMLNESYLVRLFSQFERIKFLSIHCLSLHKCKNRDFTKV